jgi:hypothetical protein
MLTANEAAAFLEVSAKARIIAVQQVADFERSQSENIPLEAWSKLFAAWGLQNRQLREYSRAHQS